MQGFKPMKSGMKSGFKFPSSMGFTGSTGKTTNVGGYTRMRAKFADGGAVRKEGRMSIKVLGDVGRATVSRAKPTTAEDQASGGRTPLRAGYKKGGKTMKRGNLPMMQMRMKKADGGDVRMPKRGPKVPRPGLGGAITDMVESVSDAFAPKALKQRKSKIDREVEKAGG